MGQWVVSGLAWRCRSFKVQKLWLVLVFVSTGTAAGATVYRQFDD